MRNKYGYWSNEENCRKAAEDCDSKSEFGKKYPSAYKQAKKVREDGKRWIDNYHHFKRPVDKKRKWIDNYDAVCKEGSKYKTRSEFQKKCNRAYTIALQNGWLDDIPFEKAKNVYKDEINVIYAYVFKDFNSVYIGRTYRQEDRHIEHKYRGTVYNFSKEHNVEIPEPTILLDNLTLEESTEWENYYVKKYKEEGWNVLNKAKTGKFSGSVGSLKSGKITKNKCRKIAENYKTRSDFAKNDAYAYNKAIKNGWINDYPWMKESKTAPKPVIRLTLNGALSKAYNSFSDTKKDGFNVSTVLQCCSGKFKQHKGFKWIQDTVDNFLIKKMNQNIANKGVVLRKTT